MNWMKEIVAPTVVGLICMGLIVLIVWTMEKRPEYIFFPMLVVGLLCAGWWVGLMILSLFK